MGGELIGQFLTLFAEAFGFLGWFSVVGIIIDFYFAANVYIL